MSLISGVLLIAEPFLGDQHFERAVVLLCEHSSEGSFGLVLNKPVEYKLSQLIDTTANFEVFTGGPVQTDTLHFIHRRPDLIEDSISLGNDIYWSGNYDKLIMVLNLNLLESSEIRFFVGYSGWGGGQLESEYTDKAWYIAITSADEVFDTNPKNYWREVLKKKGGKFKVIANYPLDPNLN
jgi:putative transcriptional regulator